jgi:hypothetical protein
MPMHCCQRSARLQLPQRRGMGAEQVATSLQTIKRLLSHLVDDAEGGVLVGRPRVEAQDAGGAVDRIRVPLAPVRGRLVLVDEVREEDVELVALQRTGLDAVSPYTIPSFTPEVAQEPAQGRCTG